MTSEHHATTSTPGVSGTGRFTTLPERIPLEETVPGKDVTEAPDPDGGRDNETEFMLRHM